MGLSKRFTYLGREAQIDGHVSGPGDPLGRFGRPRSDDAEKQRRMLAAKKRKANKRRKS